jgi:hypothetical protein
VSLEEPPIDPLAVQVRAETEFSEIVGQSALDEVRRARRSILLRQPVSLPRMIQQPDGSWKAEAGSTAAVVRTGNGWIRIVAGSRGPLPPGVAAELDRLLADGQFWREAAFPPQSCVDGGSQILVVRYDGRARTSAQRCGQSGITGRIGTIVLTGSLPEPPSVRIDRLGGAFVRLFRFSSGIDQPMTQVIRTQAEWETLWRWITARGSQPHVPPAIDFDRDMLLAAAMGTRPSGGYSIEIDRVAEGETELIAHVVRTSPGSRCGVTAALTQPVDVVSVPISPKPVRWVFRDQVRDCP